MKHPIPATSPGTLNNRQKTLAAFMALGMAPAEAAERLGVSVSYVNVILKGQLFQYEVDKARKELIGERLDEYTKLVSEQLIPNLQTLIAIRDNDATAPAARLRAIELINEALVPKAKPAAPVQATVKYHLTPEQAAKAERAIGEATTLESGTGSSK